MGSLGPANQMLMNNPFRLNFKLNSQRGAQMIVGNQQTLEVSNSATITNLNTERLQTKESSFRNDDKQYLMN